MTDDTFLRDAIRSFIKIEEIDLNKTESSSYKTYSKKLMASLETLTSTKKDLCHEYEVITNIVFELNKTDFERLIIFFEGTNSGMPNIYNEFVGKIMNTDGWKNFDWKDPDLGRFIRHIKLSCYQRKYMDNMADKLKRLSEEAKKASNEAKTTSYKAKTTSDRAKRKVNGMYSEFVSILAIFTAMSFAMMGSVQALGNLFKDIKSPSVETLAYALIIGGIYLIILYFVIMMLVMSIKKLFDNSVLSQRYPFNYGFAVATVVVSSSFIISGFFLLNKANLCAVVIALIIIAITIIIALMIFYYRNNKAKNSS